MAASLEVTAVLKEADLLCNLEVMAPLEALALFEKARLSCDVEHSCLKCEADIELGLDSEFTASQLAAGVCLRQGTACQVGALKGNVDV